MANMDVGTPRFYCDYINYLMSRGEVQNGNFDVYSAGGTQLAVATGSEAELFDMRPLNQVTFATTGGRQNHVNITLDLRTSGLKIDFVAILNHNMHPANGKFRISHADTGAEANIQAVDFGSATAMANVTEAVGVESISNNIVTPDDTDSWGRGHTIVTFDEVDPQFVGIQFEGSRNAGDTGAGDYFDDAINLAIGCILVGQYYDMPHSPDMTLKRSIAFDAVDVNESLGGQRYSTMTNHGRQVITNSNKSPFVTYYNDFGAYGGRMSYELAFSYLNSTDVMPNNYNEPQGADEAVVEDLWNRTNGRHIPFIFTQDKTSTDYSDYLFARFGQDSLDMGQVAHKLWNIQMKIDEEF